MSISHRYHTARSKLALELTMRDALAGLEELANMDVYSFEADCLEILSIEPPHPPEARMTAPTQARVSAAILNFPDKQRRVG